MSGFAARSKGDVTVIKPKQFPDLYKGGYINSDGTTYMGGSGAFSVNVDESKGEVTQSLLKPFETIQVDSGYAEDRDYDKDVTRNLRMLAGDKGLAPPVGNKDEELVKAYAAHSVENFASYAPNVGLDQHLVEIDGNAKPTGNYPTVLEVILNLQGNPIFGTENQPNLRARLDSVPDDVKRLTSITLLPTDLIVTSTNGTPQLATVGNRGAAVKGRLSNEYVILQTLIEQFVIAKDLQGDKSFGDIIVTLAEEHRRANLKDLGSRSRGDLEKEIIQKFESNGGSLQHIFDTVNLGELAFVGEFENVKKFDYSDRKKASEYAQQYASSIVSPLTVKVVHPFDDHSKRILGFAELVDPSASLEANFKAIGHYLSSPGTVHFHGFEKGRDGPGLRIGSQESKKIITHLTRVDAATWRAQFSTATRAGSEGSAFVAFVKTFLNKNWGVGVNPFTNSGVRMGFTVDPLKKITGFATAPLNHLLRRRDEKGNYVEVDRPYLLKRLKAGLPYHTEFVGPNGEKLANANAFNRAGQTFNGVQLVYMLDDDTPMVVTSNFHRTSAQAIKNFRCISNNGHALAYEAKMKNGKLTCVPVKSINANKLKSKHASKEYLEMASKGESYDLLDKTSKRYGQARMAFTGRSVLETLKGNQLRRNEGDLRQMALNTVERQSAMARFEDKKGQPAVSNAVQAFFLYAAAGAATDDDKMKWLELADRAAINPVDVGTRVNAQIENDDLAAAVNAEQGKADELEALIAGVARLGVTLKRPALPPSSARRSGLGSGGEGSYSQALEQS